MKLAYLFASSLLLSTGIHLPVKSEVNFQQVLDSMSPDEYGFIEKVVTCTDLSHVIVSQRLEQEKMENDGFYPTYFIKGRINKKEYYRLFIDYFKRNGRHPFDELYEIREKPLAKKIERYVVTKLNPVERGTLCRLTSVWFFRHLKQQADKARKNQKLQQEALNKDKHSRRHMQCQDAKDYMGCMNYNQDK